MVGCERGKNYKNNENLTVFCRKMIKCLFRLSSVPNGEGWIIKVKCEIHIHDLEKTLDSYDILDYLKPHKRQVINDTMKYQMATRFIMGV